MKEAALKILIIEDNQDIVEAIAVGFQIRWPEVKLLSTHLGEKGVDMVEADSPDVVILDLGLPDISGFEVLRRIRLFSDALIIILTVRAEEPDIMKGLEWGADDYMVKPFSHLELLARVRALLRRHKANRGDPPLAWGQLRLDTGTRHLVVGDREMTLTRTESIILHQLMKNAGQVVSHSTLAEAAWREYTDFAAASLRVYVRRLRKRIEANPNHPRLLRTKAGVGYYLANPSQD